MTQLSIITINLNNAEGLQNTLESIKIQTFNEYELIVIDGGSTDVSIEIIKKYSKTISYWISEPDKGIYNAMNKGIKQAKGDYCFFLNSGDLLISDNTLKTIFSKNLKEDIIYCNIETENGLIKYPKKITFSFLFMGTIAHQATLINKELLQNNNLYNEEYRFVSDWELYCKAYLDKRNFRKVDIIICHYDLTGVSARNQDLIKKERETVLMKLIPDFYNDYARLSFYEGSKIVQLISKVLKSKFYKRLRKPMYTIDNN